MYPDQPVQLDADVVKASPREAGQGCARRLRLATHDLSDEEILARLLALNLERAEQEKVKQES